MFLYYTRGFFMASLSAEQMPHQTYNKIEFNKKQFLRPKKVDKSAERFHSNWFSEKIQATAKTNYFRSG